MTIDQAVGELAERQHGAIATRQLRLLGADRDLQRRRVRAGPWRMATSRVVIINGAPNTPEQQLMVAVLHAGPTAMASHESAAWLWQLPGFAECDIVMRSRAHGAPAADGHRPTLILPHHRTVVRGIPTASLPRTIFDLAGTLPLGRTARLVDTVVTRSPAMLAALHRTLPELARRGRSGIAVMRLLLDERPVGTKVPASGNEAKFERICDNAGIRGLERQVDVGGHSWLGRVDYCRRDIGLIVEVDSRLHHTSVIDKANDAARDAATLAAGWKKVLRIYEEDIWYRPWFVVEQLREAYRELGALAA